MTTLRKTPPSVLSKMTKALGNFMTETNSSKDAPNFQQAKESVLEYLSVVYTDYPDTAAQLVIDDCRIWETDHEWIISWNVKEYVETRDILEAIIDAQPIAVSKKDGSLRGVKKSEMKY